MHNPDNPGGIPAAAGGEPDHIPGTDGSQEVWPALPYEEWKDTYETVHMWTQIVGKIRLAYSPPVNHWWHTTLYVTPRGLTTSPIPYAARTFEIQFDFIGHTLQVQTSDGRTRSLGLYPRSVADFYQELMAITRSLGIEVKIDPMPQEIPDPIRCDLDQIHASYDPEYIDRFRRILVQTDRVFKEFRGGFIGKCSPVHFFWGSFDLAVTRFSGRRAPQQPGMNLINREAYSHECSSAGFWPGSGSLLKPAFYTYTVPEPHGTKTAAIRPSSASYDRKLGEFIFLYEDVRAAPRPEEALLEFLHSTYEAGAILGNWDRSSLERKP